ncbi:hypothetical protein CRM22_005323 [Opisthorchis felineus]|nr:hypothetical protein CRM22_005323 [Opisthorchis felineus]
MSFAAHNLSTGLKLQLAAKRLETPPANQLLANHGASDYFWGSGQPVGDTHFTSLQRFFGHFSTPTSSARTMVMYSDYSCRTLGTGNQGIWEDLAVNADYIAGIRWRPHPPTFPGANLQLLRFLTLEVYYQPVAHTCELNEFIDIFGDSGRSFELFLPLVRSRTGFFSLINKRPIRLDLSCARPFTQRKLLNHPMSFVYSSVRNKRLEFEQSILEFLSDGEECTICLFQNGNEVHIDSSEMSAVQLPVRRAWFCPFASRSQAYLRENVDTSAKAPTISAPRHVHIPVASACLLESPSRDGLILTRRPRHMRSYPGQWVPPGGHCDPGEPVQLTAVRELCEELGLESDSVPVDQWKERASSLLHPLCAWEAAYPTLTTPKSHHLVVYYAVMWWQLDHPQSKTSDPYLPQLNIQEDEVSSAVCLPISVLQSLVNDWTEFEQYCRCSCTSVADLLSLPSPLPGTLAVNSLTKRVWLWTAEEKCWRPEQLNRLICGLTSNPRVVHCRGGEETGPSCVSTGTLYAISR